MPFGLQPDSNPGFADKLSIKVARFWPQWIKILFSKKTSAQHLDHSCFQSTNEINPSEWNAVAGDSNVYVSLDYLSALETSLQKEMIFRYVIFYDTERSPVAIAIIQVLNFVDKGKTENEYICFLRKKIRSRLFRSSGLKILNCGTPFASGENGFVFLHSVSPETAYTNLSRVLLGLQKSDPEVRDARIVLVKEFWPESFGESELLKKSGFNEFSIDVNMVMQIPPEWRSIDDYLSSMVTKFRTKAKTAFRRSEELFCKEFDAADISNYKKEINDLYLAVLQRSDFRFGALNEESFLNLKINLGEKFWIKGYFLGKELVGFCSAFVFDSVVDANYVGFNYSLNQDFAIYQRMLYDFIDLAIRKNCSELRFGRTAEEIKSSVGAKPEEMKLFIRHRNPIANRIVKRLIASIRPSKYELRKPFKVNFSHNGFNHTNSSG